MMRSCWTIRRWLSTMRRISGELVEGRIVYDAFVLDNKKMAIYYEENKPSA